MGWIEDKYIAPNEELEWPYCGETLRDKIDEEHYFFVQHVMIEVVDD